MKIVAVLEDVAAGGGGFNQALNALVQMRDLCAGRFAFEVLTTRAENLEALRELGIEAELFAYAIADKLLSLSATNSWWQSAQARLRWTGPFERNLLRRGCDLVYFVAPSPRIAALQRLNYVVTLLDLCHRDTPEFPEVREFGEFALRERLYRAALPAAVAVLADSPALADAAARRYGLDRDRLVPMPFAPAPFLAAEAPPDTTAVLRRHGLEQGYFFYPGQLWAHKNHARVLQAMRLLKQRGHVARAAFAGGDKGNRAHLESLAAQYGVGAQVRFLGFVPAADMRALYDGCRAVVMPTYFGPTNIPPLEAWLTGKPLVYSRQLREQAGDAALYADPDDAESLAQALLACEDAATRARLVEAGKRRLDQIERERKAAEADLLAHLLRFEARKACWA